MTKYIFLDYDGVIKPFSRVPDMLPQDESVCMGHLTELLETIPDCWIILTTDNRYSFSLSEMKGWFPSDVASRIIAETTTELYVPSAKEHYDQYIETRQADIRDKEIALYINENDIDPEDCVAIDDIWEITCIPMVRTESDSGLTEKKAEEAFMYLTGQKPFYNLNEEVVTLSEF